MNMCTQTVKNEYGVKTPCGQVLSDKGCSRKSEHIGSYVSGFCSAGMHEGLAPKNFRETPLPTCQMWLTCACNCHDSYSQMFQMGGRERFAVNNSSYVADHGDFVMPDPADVSLARLSSNTSPATPPKRIESELPDVIPATIARQWIPTPTGRSARGELEAQIKWACDVWVVERDPEFCTPRYVSEEIGRQYGIRPPSVGAIDAAWKKWAKIGFARIGVKPTRFVGYTPEGIELTLEGCKEKYKRSYVNA